MKLFRYPSDL